MTGMHWSPCLGPQVRTPPKIISQEETGERALGSWTQTTPDLPKEGCALAEKHAEQREQDVLTQANAGLRKEPAAHGEYSGGNRSLPPNARPGVIIIMVVYQGELKPILR